MELRMNMNMDMKCGVALSHGGGRQEPDGTRVDDLGDCKWPNVLRR